MEATPPMRPAHNSDTDPTPELRRLDDDFEKAPNRSEPPVIPDGSYRVRVERVDITTARTSGRSLLKWRLRILGPTSTGRLLWRNNVLAPGPGLRWLKHDLQTCGLMLDKLSDLPDHIDKLVDLELDVSKRTVGDHANVYLNRRLDPATHPAAATKTPF